MQLSCNNRIRYACNKEFTRNPHIHNVHIHSQVRMNRLTYRLTRTYRHTYLVICHNSARRCCPHSRSHKDRCNACCLSNIRVPSYKLMKAIYYIGLPKWIHTIHYTQYIKPNLICNVQNDRRQLPLGQDLPVPLNVHKVLLVVWRTTYISGRCDRPLIHESVTSTWVLQIRAEINFENGFWNITVVTSYMICKVTFRTMTFIHSFIHSFIQYNADRLQSDITSAACMVSHVCMWCGPMYSCAAVLGLSERSILRHPPWTSPRKHDFNSLTGPKSEETVGLEPPTIFIIRTAILCANHCATRPPLLTTNCNNYINWVCMCPCLESDCSCTVLICWQVEYIVLSTL
jgi:hypothetical protein